MGADLKKNKKNSIYRPLTVNAIAGFADSFECFRQSIAEARHRRARLYKAKHSGQPWRFVCFWSLRDRLPLPGGERIPFDSVAGDQSLLSIGPADQCTVELGGGKDKHGAGSGALVQLGTVRRYVDLARQLLLSAGGGPVSFPRPFWCPFLAARSTAKNMRPARTSCLPVGSLMRKIQCGSTAVVTGLGEGFNFIAIQLAISAPQGRGGLFRAERTSRIRACKISIAHPPRRQHFLTCVHVEPFFLFLFAVEGEIFAPENDGLQRGRLFRVGSQARFHRSVRTTISRGPTGLLRMFDPGPSIVDWSERTLSEGFVKSRS